MLKECKTEQKLVISVYDRNSYKARADFYEKEEDTWKKIISNMYAVVGKNGIVENRVQNTSTTQVGEFGFIYGFGIKEDPGIQYPYRQITMEDYWVTDPNSIYYNRLVNRYKGWDKKEQEHLIEFGYLYNYAMVIDFNYVNPIKGVGAGIFLHVASKEGTGTAGCIGLKEETLVKVMKRLNPKKCPKIIIEELKL